jgi:hypothetical protein
MLGLGRQSTGMLPIDWTHWTADWAAQVHGFAIFSYLGPMSPMSPIGKSLRGKSGGILTHGLVDRDSWTRNRYKE